MQNVLIVGAGTGGTAILQLLTETAIMNITAIVDVNPQAPGLLRAKKLGIATGANWQDYLTDEIDVIIEATGDQKTLETIQDMKQKETILIPGSVAYIIAQLIDEKQQLFNELKQQAHLQDLILNATHDGMIAIDQAGKVILFNKRAEKLLGKDKESVLGKQVTMIIPKTALIHVLQTKTVEMNQAFTLDNGRQVVTTRVPILDEAGTVIGAFAVFKDITEVVELAEEMSDLKEMRTMLEAIIQSSQEAISVVDQNGNGIMINRAYSKLTGLFAADIVGKPATADISEGESMHLQVLKTREPVRGVRMKVGPSKKDVIVNVAPVIVDGALKGSVGVIHDVSEIQSLTKELEQAKRMIRTLEAKYNFIDIIGESEEMQFAKQQAKLGAKTPVTVLLRGESGTGKELFAHAIHNESNRKYHKFIRVNCAAIPVGLLESELFGYEEGAFSGAKRGGKIGLFEEANNGSIFLDEIAELSLNTQAKLLRVLQEREIVRVGGTKSIPIDVRMIAATNVNLEKAIAAGTMREDLYYRINRFPIHIPALRHHTDDIPILCTHLIHKLNQDYGRNITGITAQALSVLTMYRWPGNVRELENVLGRAMINMQLNEREIDGQHLPALHTQHRDKLEKQTIVTHAPLKVMLHEFERNMIISTLQTCSGNKTEAAKALGISVRALYYKLEKWSLEEDGMQ